MIGEILLTIIVSCLIWFIVFKVLRKVADKKLITNIETGLEKQQKKFFTDGKEIDIKKELALGKETPSPENDLEVPTPIENQSPPSNMGEELPGEGLNSSGGSNNNSKDVSVIDGPPIISGSNLKEENKEDKKE